jgi:membrane fusion protein, heavy metal efflux system
MPVHDHEPALRGRVVLWGGTGLGALLLLALATHGFGLGGASKQSSAAAPWTIRDGDKISVPDFSPLRARITVEPASTQLMGSKLVVPGIVEAEPSRTAIVLPQLTGRIVELKVQLGERVKRGQVLVVLESADLAQAYSDFDKANDAFSLTRINLDRQQAQVKIGVASDKDLDQARSENSQAESEYRRAEARLKILDAPLHSRGSARRLEVRAPFGGAVITLGVSPGSIINDATQQLLTIADLGSIWVTAMVPEGNVATIAKGQDAEIRLTAYPERVMHGSVLFVGDIVEADSRREKIRIALSNADYSIKPNMFAQVTLTGPAQSRVVLPTSSLLMNNDRFSVFVETAPWVFERRTVDAQVEDGPVVGIRSGVAAGDRVAVKGGILIND